MDNLPIMASSNNLATRSGFPGSALGRHGQDQTLALDLNQLLVRHAGSTYLFRIVGHHWADQGIFDGDVAVIDRAAQAGSQDLIIAWKHQEAALCRQHQLTADDTPWGVVTAVIHTYRT